MMRGRMQVVDDVDALAHAAAERIVTRLSRGSGIRAVALTGGRTPEALYRLLATVGYRSRIPWPEVHWFWGDERFVAHDDPRNNARMALDALLAHVPVPPSNIHRIPTDVPGPAESARLYEATLREFHGGRALDEPVFSLVLMGMGADGHTASLYPGDPALEEEERWVLPIAQAKLEPFVPRVTLTFPALASTHEMLFLVSGADKREALARIERGEPLPAGRATSRGELAWLVENGVATPDDLDTVVREGLARRWRHVGPLRAIALGGIDTWNRSGQNIVPELSRSPELPDLQGVAITGGNLAGDAARRDAALAAELREPDETEARN